jgi:hypothetical protein
VLAEATTQTNMSNAQTTQLYDETMTQQAQLWQNESLTAQKHACMKNIMIKDVATRDKQ